MMIQSIVLLSFVSSTDKHTRSFAGNESENNIIDIIIDPSKPSPYRAYSTTWECTSDQSASMVQHCYQISNNTIIAIEVH